MQEPTALETFKAVAEIAQVNETESGVIMEGLALPYGVTSRNGMRYQTESVREAAGEYAGRPILFNHNQDVVLGHVESVEDREDGLYYRANLDAAEESVVRKIRRGDIKNVSIQASFDPARSTYDKKTESYDVYVTEFLELSVVTIPGFADTTAQVVEQAMLMTSKQEAAPEEAEPEAQAQLAEPEEAASEEAPEEQGGLEERLEALESRVSAVETTVEGMKPSADDEEDEEEEERSESAPEVVRPSEEEKHNAPVASESAAQHRTEVSARELREALKSF